MTLTEFLLARIAEDEAAAHITLKGFALMEHRPTGLTVLGEVVYTPARALAECEAKRRIVTGAKAIRGRDKSYTERLKHTDTEDAVYVIAGDILRHLAAIYADHPDFREEWRV